MRYLWWRLVIKGCTTNIPILMCVIGTFLISTKKKRNGLYQWDSEQWDISGCGEIPLVKVKSLAPPQAAYRVESGKHTWLNCQSLKKKNEKPDISIYCSLKVLAYNSIIMNGTTSYKHRTGFFFPNKSVWDINVERKSIIQYLEMTSATFARRLLQELF